MGIFERLSRWWNGDREAAVVDDDDLVMQAILSRAFQTGNVIIANRRDDGTVEIEEVDPASSEEIEP